MLRRLKCSKSTPAEHCPYRPTHVRRKPGYRRSSSIAASNKGDAHTRQEEAGKKRQHRHTLLRASKGAASTGSILESLLHGQKHKGPMYGSQGALPMMDGAAGEGTSISIQTSSKISDDVLSALIQTTCGPSYSHWGGSRSEQAPLELPSEYLEGIPEVDAKECAKFFSYLSKSGNLDEALRLVERVMTERRTDIASRLIHKPFLRKARDQRAVKEGIELVNLLGPREARGSTFTMLLDVCARKADMEAAAKVVDIMSKFKVPMDQYHYSSLINVCARAGSADTAFKYFQDCLVSGVRLDGHVYGSLLAALAGAMLRNPQVMSDRKEQLVLLERAVMVMDNAMKAGVFLDAPVWNALLCCAGRCCQLQRAFQILDDMQRKGVAPTAVTYSNLIMACNLAEEPTLALRVYNRALKAGYTDNAIIYTAALSACSISEPVEFEVAMDIYSLAQRNSAVLDDLFYGALIIIVGKVGKPEVVCDLIEDMRGGGLEPGQATCSAAIHACLLNGNVLAAKTMYDVMARQGVYPSRAQYNALMERYAVNSDLTVVVSLLSDMVRLAGLQANANTYRILFRACQRTDQAELAFEVWSIMKARGQVPKEYNAQAICYEMLKICFNRIRSSWRPGGYPPKDPSSHTSGASSYVGSVLQEEATTMLQALTGSANPRTSFLFRTDSPNWTQLAVSVYRDFLAVGLKPNLEVLDKLLACLRIQYQPGREDFNNSSSFFSSSTTTSSSSSSVPSVSPSYDPVKFTSLSRPSLSPPSFTSSVPRLATQPASPQSVFPSIPTASNIQPSTTGTEGPVLELPFDRRAITLLEEAISMGVLPSAKAEEQLTIDMTRVPPIVAELWTITLMNNIQQRARQSTEKVRYCHAITIKVPPFDPALITWPSYVEKLHQYHQLHAPKAQTKRRRRSTHKESEGGESLRPGALYGVEAASGEDLVALEEHLVAGQFSPTSSLLESWDDEGLHRTLGVESEYIASSATSLAVGATFRRLKAFSKLDGRRGVIKVMASELRSWIARNRFETSFCSTTTPVVVGASTIMDQQRRIRMGFPRALPRTRGASEEQYGELGASSQDGREPQVGLPGPSSVAPSHFAPPSDLSPHYQLQALDNTKRTKGANGHGSGAIERRDTEDNLKSTSGSGHQVHRHHILRKAGTNIRLPRPLLSSSFLGVNTQELPQPTSEEPNEAKTSSGVN